MNKQPIYRFYWFGTCLRFLQDATHRYRVHGGGNALENIEAFFDYLDTFGLVVTKRVAEEKLDALHDELNVADEAALLTDGQASQLSRAMSEIRTTLDAEIKGIYSYTPTPKRLDLEKLLSSVHKLFTPGVFERLPDIAKYDFSEAGKCIAFELPTSAAFHILRGTESVLRHYYGQMVRQNRVKSLMWGPVVADLRKRQKTKGYEVLNNHLDNIRLSFRNPTQHPEAIYDVHEVQDLWAVCVDVTNRMCKVLKENGCG